MGRENTGAFQNNIDLIVGPILVFEISDRGDFNIAIAEVETILCESDFPGESSVDGVILQKVCQVFC